MPLDDFDRGLPVTVRSGYRSGSLSSYPLESVAQNGCIGRQVREVHPVCLEVQRVVACQLQRFALVEAIQQGTLPADRTRPFPPEMLPEHQCIHRPGVVGVLVHPAPNARRQRIECGPVVALVTPPHLLPRRYVVDAAHRHDSPYAAMQASKPRRSCGRFSLRPMNTILEERASSAFRGLT